MIFICILIFGVLFLFFNIRQIAPGNKGSVVAGIVVALLPVCFLCRGQLWACVGQAFLSVWLCQALLLYLLWCVALGILWTVRRLLRRGPVSRRLSILAARILLAGSVAIAAVMCVAGVGNNADYRIRELEITLPVRYNGTAQSNEASQFNKTAQSTAPSRESFSLLFFSDLHVDPIFNREKLERMIHDADSIRPDYIVFGGDFADVHDSVMTRDGYDTLVAQLGRAAVVGAFAVNGNHEGYLERNGSDLRGFLQRAGWTYLDDSTACTVFACITGRTDFQVARARDIPRKPLSQLDPATLPDQAQPSNRATHPDPSAQFNQEAVPFNQEPADQEPAQFNKTSPNPSALPWILVDHQPKGIEPGHSGRLPDLALSGHTHDGQFFPGTVIIDWVWRQAYGFGELDGVKWLVSSGVGSWGPPVRVGSGTEMWLVKFTTARQ